MIKALLTQELFKRSITGLILAILGITLVLYAPFWLFSAVFILLLLAILLTEWPRLFDYKTAHFWLILPLYPLLSFILIILLQYNNYKLLNLLLFGMVATHDTGSYIAGKLWGKHKICPAISSGKTWQGFAGGCACTLILVFLFAYVIPALQAPVFALNFTLTVCTVSLAGDLFESYLKRRVGLKDSGNILPGHGGLLDRFDSALFAVIIIYLLRSLLI